MDGRVTDLADARADRAHDVNESLLFLVRQARIAVDRQPEQLDPVRPGSQLARLGNSRARGSQGSVHGAVNDEALAERDERVLGPSDDRPPCAWRVVSRDERDERGEHPVADQVLLARAQRLRRRWRRGERLS